MIIGITQDAIDFGIVRAIRIFLQQGLAGLDSSLVFILNEMNLRDVIRRLLAEARFVAQLLEFNQRLIVFAISIVDVSHIIGRSIAVGIADLLDAFEIGAGFVAFARLQKRVSQAEGISFLFGSRQHVDIAFPQPIDSLFVFRATEMHRPDAETNLVAVARIRINLQIALQQLVGIRPSLFVGGANQHIVCFLYQISVGGMFFISL